MKNSIVLEHKEIDKLSHWLKACDVVVVGAGAGLSASAGIQYSGKRFKENFEEFIRTYGLTDMYTAGFYPFKTQEEKWAYWSKHILLNRYAKGTLPVYQNLKRLLHDKDYFVITTNVDHQFHLAGFEEDRLFATQGDYGLLQCAKGCHKKLYENETLIKEMVAQQKACKIPKSLVPKCPVCGGDMDINLRKDSFFVEDDHWHSAADKYSQYLESNYDKNILFLELGIGMNTPGIIKYPFWQMTLKWPKVKYICLNLDQAWIPEEIKEKSIGINVDIGEVLNRLLEE